MNVFSSMSFPNWCDISTMADIMTIIIGIVSIRVMRSQSKTANEAVKLQKHEHQPVFKIKMPQYKSEGSDVYDIMSYVLSNDGERVKAYNGVSVTTYLKLSIAQICSRPPKRGPIYVPIDGYFGLFTNVYELQGHVYKSIETERCANNKWFGELYQKAIAYRGNHPDYYVFAELVHLTKVSYTDIYNEEHSCFFVNKKEVDELAYQEIKDSSSAIWGYRTFSMSDVDLDDLVKVVMEHGTK